MEFTFRGRFQLPDGFSSKSRSIRVLALDAVSSVFEYTILSAARQIPAKSWM